jgi:hypothetical protein
MTPEELVAQLEAEFARVAVDAMRPPTPTIARERIRSNFQELLNREGRGGQASVGEPRGGVFEITVTWPAGSWD